MALIRNVFQQSGAFNWTASQRKAFANDLVRPQLWAVYDRINHEKSDQSPDKWKPPLTSFYCTYASAWVAVKSHWRLTVTPEEKNALESMLGSC